MWHTTILKPDERRRPEHVGLHLSCPGDQLYNLNKVGNCRLLTRAASASLGFEVIGTRGQDFIRVAKYSSSTWAKAPTPVPTPV